MHKLYSFLTYTASPLVPLWLALRRAQGKEDPSRWRERFGYASLARPKGKLAWFHAASVGEAASLLPLLAQLSERFPALNLLMTTGTVTSAALMKARLPARVMHQYVPVDTPQATARFIRHWRPNYAFWTESEFWPNLIDATNRSQAFMGIINARLSERSFRGWNYFPGFASHLLRSFDVVFAQSAADGARLAALGASQVIVSGNLKFDAPMLPCDESQLMTLQTALASRPAWLAASTHPGEEKMVGRVHALLAATRPDFLTLLVPRHPSRGAEIAALLGKEFRVARRSAGEPLRADTQIYIADTLGELGLFYRLAELVFMGGSLVAHGGQNPLEPARLSCALLAGPHTHNFRDIYGDLEQAHALARVQSAEQLASELDRLLRDTAHRQRLQKAARQFVETRSGALGLLLRLLGPVFTPKPARRA